MILNKEFYGGQAWLLQLRIQDLEREIEGLDEGSDAWNDAMSELLGNQDELREMYCSSFRCVDLDDSTSPLFLPHLRTYRDMLRSLFEKLRGAKSEERRLRIALARYNSAAAALGAEPVPGLGAASIYPIPPDPARPDTANEAILLDLVISLEALLGQDDQSGEQDRLKRRASQLTSGDDPSAFDAWARLRDLWNARNKVMHGDSLGGEDWEKVVGDLRWLRRTVALCILRALEFVHLEATGRKGSGGMIRRTLYPALDRATIDDATRQIVNSRRVDGVLRPGMLKDAFPPQRSFLA